MPKKQNNFKDSRISSSGPTWLESLTFGVILDYTFRECSRHYCRNWAFRIKHSKLNGGKVVLMHVPVVSNQVMLWMPMPCSALFLRLIIHMLQLQILFSVVLAFVYHKLQVDALRPVSARTYPSCPYSLEPPPEGSELSKAKAAKCRRWQVRAWKRPGGFWMPRNCMILE